MPVQISGFSSADKVPGPYGEVVFGAGGQSAATFPLVLLLTGLATSAGNITPDTEVRPVYSLADIDLAAGAGSELACMAYDALAINEDVQIFLGAPTPAGGAVAASVTLTLTGSVTSGGSIGLRIGGFPVNIGYNLGDSLTTIATNVAGVINGSNFGRLPLSATASGPVVTITDKTASIRGNQHIVFQDATNSRGTGVTAFLGGTTWAATTTYAVGAGVVPVTGNGFYYVASAITSGTSGGSQPVFPTTIGSTVVDSGVTWKCVGLVVTGGGCTLSQGTGLETYTNLLATISNRQFDRIGLACNDATSLAAWSTQVTSQAGVLQGILQNVVFATNGTLSAMQSLTQTTLNAQRFEGVWELNSEAHPSRIAAAHACDRAATEFEDPAASYDGKVIPTVVAQSQQADWPTHSMLVAALNTGVTPLFQVGDGLARVCRAITTHCLNGSNPDYGTLDVAEGSCPDFVLKFFKVLYSGTFQVDNPRVQADPDITEALPPVGVGYPQLWSSVVEKELRRMEAGENPGTCPPILIDVADHPPVSTFDPIAKRIMSAIPVDVAPGNHQIGISVRQVAA